MSNTDKLKTFAWMVGGIVLACRPLVSPTMGWAEVGTPNFMFSVLAGAIFGLKCFWTAAPMPSVMSTK